MGCSVVGGHGPVLGGLSSPRISPLAGLAPKECEVLMAGSRCCGRRCDTSRTGCAASAGYIGKMSNCCCKHCVYNPRKVLGDKACAFDALYWDFLTRNAGSFGNNSRMNLAMSTLKRDLREIRSKARQIREALHNRPKFVETYYPGGSASDR